MAMQDQTLATKAYRVTLFEQQGSKKCRMFTEKDETVMHIPRECSKLVQAEWKKRHGKVATVVPWKQCSKCGFVPAKNNGINWPRAQ